MNVEKLRRLQAQVRIGGKGTPRRKKKVLHQTAATDDKKLQSSLKKLSVSTIPGIEEVNIIKDDLTVIHFNNPKAQASLSANTFAVTGHGESKKVVEMLPEILPQLGQDTVVQLRMFANSMAGNQKEGNTASSVGSGAVVDNLLASVVEEDDVPMLVSDFDEVAKLEAVSVEKDQTKVQPKGQDDQTPYNDSAEAKKEMTIAHQAPKPMDAEPDGTDNISSGEMKNEQKENHMNLNVTGNTVEKSVKDAKKGKKQEKQEVKSNEKQKNKHEAKSNEKAKDKAEIKAKEQAKDNQEAITVEKTKNKEDVRTEEKAKDIKVIKPDEKGKGTQNDKQQVIRDTNAEEKPTEVRAKDDSQPKVDNNTDSQEMVEIKVELKNSADLKDQQLEAKEVKESKEQKQEVKLAGDVPEVESKQKKNEAEGKKPDVNKRSQQQNKKVAKATSEEAKVPGKATEDNKTKKGNEGNNLKDGKHNANIPSNVEANAEYIAPAIKNEDNLSQQPQQASTAMGAAIPETKSAAVNTTEQITLVAETKSVPSKSENKVHILKSADFNQSESSLLEAKPKKLEESKLPEDEKSKAVVNLEPNEEVAEAKATLLEKVLEAPAKSAPITTVAIHSTLTLSEVLKSAAHPQPIALGTQEQNTSQELHKLKLPSKLVEAMPQTPPIEIAESKIETKAMPETAQQQTPAKPPKTESIDIQDANKSENKPPIATSPQQKASPPKQTANKKTASPTKENTKQQSKPAATAPAVATAKLLQKESKKSKQPTVPKTLSAPQQQQQASRTQNAAAKGQQSPPTTPTKTPDKPAFAPKPTTPPKAATPPTKTQVQPAKKGTSPTIPIKTAPGVAVETIADNQNVAEAKGKPATPTKQPAEAANKAKKQNVNNKARPSAAKNAAAPAEDKQTSMAKKPEDVVSKQQMPAMQEQSGSPAHMKSAVAGTVGDKPVSSASAPIPALASGQVSAVAPTQAQPQLPQQPSTKPPSPSQPDQQSGQK